MMTRLSFDTNLEQCIDSMQAFTTFSAKPQDIRNVHKVLMPDFNLASFADEYSDIQLHLEEKKSATEPKSARAVLQYLTREARASTCEKNITSPVAVALARILVCKPHSADCERLISAYNRLKTANRSSLNRKTISEYLYVNVNMPKLCDFDPMPAVVMWLNDKERRNREVTKASKQAWFQTVFEDECEDEVDEDLDTNEGFARKRKF